MSETLTPMMRQYQSIRRGLPANTLLLFRLGDFYEMFFDDAKEAAAILNVALTKRNGVPMCGIPHHAAEGYIAKLIKAGKRAAIGDQIGEAQPGKLVARELTRIITPGTVGDENLLDAKRGHYLAAVHSLKGRIGFALVDLSTGEFRVTELDSASAVRDEIARATPAEILVSDEDRESAALLPTATAHDGFAFLHDHAYFALRDHFKVQSLDGFGCGEMPAAIGAAGAVLHYLEQQLRRKTDHITTLQTYRTGHFVELGEATQEHLELVSPRGARNTSLLGALDRTVTPMGGRRLRAWILHPLRDRAELERRQDTIASFLEDPARLNEIRETLGAVRDIERTSGRLGQASGNGRDLAALRVSLETIPAVKALLRAPVGSPDLVGESPDAPALLMELACAMGDFPELVETLASALVGEPPATIKEGGIFREGYDAALDELRSASTEGKHWLADLQQREIERTGVKSLKVRYNSVFGYFIEITKSNLASVPEDYIRKQTVANAERFITPELKEMEGKILGADERMRHLEYELFVRLRERVLEHLAALQRTASALADLDALASLAETARLFGYCRPELRDDLVLEIKDGRHPVLDQNIAGEKFVPNDVHLDGETCRLIILTGPNMAGKSTYIRQVALLALMAQTGSFVPAARARIGLVDRIFTRVGASDDLSRGQSTFMVEMNETANIANNATERSLVILDEIGRGTSTFDGLSIAWSVAEHLHDTVRARTLFATHYHELTDLARTRTGVKNFNVAVREWNEQIIFLHKILEGAADKSYGIQVARLAGLPPSLIARAREILENLEKAELNADGQPALAVGVPRLRRPRREGGEPEGSRPQLTLF